MRASSALALPAIAAVAALVLAGCGGGDDAARSAEAETEVAGVSVASAADATDVASVTDASAAALAATEVAVAPEEPNNLIERVAASNKGSRLCVSNSTGGSTLNVTFTKADTSSSGAIAPGQSACGEGTYFLGNDVAGEIKFPPGTNNTTFDASNPWAGSPIARLLTAGPGWSTDCAVGNKDSTSGENVHDSCFTPKFGFQLWRVTDTQWKEFVVIVRDNVDS